MQFFRYDIPLHPSPLPLQVRTGLILQTEQGWGEISPLPGFSRETLDEALNDLEQQTLPSVQFGFASAQTPFPKEFPDIPICALASTYEEAKRASVQGYKTIKIKAKSPRETLSLLDRIKPFNFRLRIDINRKWSLSETRFFLENLSSEIDYLEEPLSDPNELVELPSCPLALDETLVQEGGEKFCSLATTLVLKPTLLGKRIHDFLKMRKRMVFSSSFESPIGLMHIAHLQARYAPQEAAGIDTARFFKKLEQKCLKKIH